MFDFKFDWDKRIEIGIEIVDLQHQELFRIGREIERLILTGCQHVNPQQILEQLCELREYATYHFYTEEELMKAANSPDFEVHKKQHDAFLSEINSVDCEKLVNQPTEEFIKIKARLQEWLFQHMLTADKNIANSI